MLVWQADTRSINPAVHPQLIADAYAAADIAAAAEYLAEFHRDIEGFVSREAGDAVVARGGREFLPLRQDRYVVAGPSLLRVSGTSCHSSAHRSCRATPTAAAVPCRTSV